MKRRWLEMDERRYDLYRGTSLFPPTPRNTGRLGRIIFRRSGSRGDRLACDLLTARLPRA